MVMPPINLNAVTVLWSPTQQCFHRETLGETIKAGLEAFGSKARVDYILIGIFDTLQESQEFLRKMRAKRREFYFADELETRA